jgi:hypothetical protein
MHIKKILYVMVLLTGIGIMACSSDGDGDDFVSNDPGNGEEEQIIITDQTGRAWDITHAFYEYGMSREYFNFGIGVGAIPSVDNPQVVYAQSGLAPDPDSEMPVFGVELGGEARAYPVELLNNHEVVNDIFPEDAGYVSVAY